MSNLQGANDGESGFITWVRRNQILSFLILTLVLTWPFLISDALGSRANPPSRLPIPIMIIMAYQPTLAAVIVSWVVSGGEGVKKLLRRILVWRVGIVWYFIVIFGVALLLVLPVLIAKALGGSYPIFSEGFAEMPGLLAPAMLLVLLIVSTLVNGEEFGWRGFALPRLQSKHNALTSSLFIGVMWALFHLPLFWSVGSTQANEPIIGFFLRIVAASIIVTWVFNNTRGSVFISMLLHGAINTWSGVFYGIDTAHVAPGQVYWISIAVIWLAAALIIIAYGPLRLSKKSESEQLIVIEEQFQSANG